MTNNNKLIAKTICFYISFFFKNVNILICLYIQYLILNFILATKTFYNYKINNNTGKVFISTIFYDIKNFNYDNILPQVSYTVFNFSHLEDLYDKLHFLINIRLIYISIYKIVFNLEIPFIIESSMSLFYLYKKNIIEVIIKGAHILPKESLPIILYLVDLSTLA